MLAEISTEFERIATLKNADYVNKKTSELEEYVQQFDFSQMLINWIPITDFVSEISDSGSMVYPLNCRIQFLQIADKADNFEAQKDILIDQTIGLAQSFFFELNKNVGLIFQNYGWDLRFKVLRPFLTSNYIVGVEVSITLETACNRIVI